jgi:hypothetical protein
MHYRFFGSIVCKRLMWGKTQYENRYGQGVNRKQVMAGAFQKKKIFGLFYQADFYLPK